MDLNIGDIVRVRVFGYDIPQGELVKVVPCNLESPECNLTHIETLDGLKGTTIASRGLGVIGAPRFRDFLYARRVRIQLTKDEVIHTMEGIVTVEGGSVRLGKETWLDWRSADNLEILEVANGN